MELIDYASIEQRWFGHVSARPGAGRIALLRTATSVPRFTKRMQYAWLYSGRFTSRW